jgi:hypothetical protein
MPTHLNLPSYLSYTSTNKRLDLLFVGSFFSCDQQQGMHQSTAVDPIQILLLVLLLVQKFGLQNDVVVEYRPCFFFEDIATKLQLPHYQLDHL